MRPSATAAAFLPSSVVVSSIWPVAIRMTWTALPITSAGRFSPFGPRGIPDRLLLCGKHATIRGWILAVMPIDAFLTTLLSEDELGVVVRAHIHIEHELEKFLCAALENPNELGRLEYSARVRLALACGLRADLKGPLNAFGALRNRFSH